MKSLWVDDWRTPTEGFQGDVAKTYQEAVKLLETNVYETIYLDHDLGLFSWIDNKEYTGHDIIMWLIERKRAGNAIPTKYVLLTANPRAKTDMQYMIEHYLS